MHYILLVQLYCGTVQNFVLVNLLQSIAQWILHSKQDYWFCFCAHFFARLFNQWAFHNLIYHLWHFIIILFLVLFADALSSGSCCVSKVGNQLFLQIVDSVDLLILMVCHRYFQLTYIRNILSTRSDNSIHIFTSLRAALTDKVDFIVFLQLWSNMKYSLSFLYDYN